MTAVNAGVSVITMVGEAGTPASGLIYMAVLVFAGCHSDRLYRRLLLSSSVQKGLSRNKTKWV